MTVKYVREMQQINTIITVCYKCNRAIFMIPREEGLDYINSPINHKLIC